MSTDLQQPASKLLNCIPIATAAMAVKMMGIILNPPLGTCSFYQQKEHSLQEIHLHLILNRRKLNICFYGLKLAQEDILEKD
uniref:Putative ovule protein n=1 Tax=Solanum chacoense TaxID=4108 RepID=A0A0V0HTE9_SOLCH